MTHLKRFGFAAILSLCSLVCVGVCDGEVRRAPAVEQDAGPAKMSADERQACAELAQVHGACMEFAGDCVAALKRAASSLHGTPLPAAHDGIILASFDPAAAAGDTSPRTSAMALGAGIPDPDTDPAGFLSALVALAAAKKWLALAMLIVIGGVSLLRRFVKPLQTDRAGAILAVAAGIATALGGALIDGASVSPELLVDSLVVGFGVAVGAGGLRQWLKRFFFPKDAPDPAATR